MLEIIDEKAVISRICFLRETYAGKRGKALFAKTLGISPSTYNYYEQDRLPPVEILWAICRLTGADIQWLLTGRSGASTDHNTGILPGPLLKKITSLLQTNPKATFALEAFVELLQQKTRLEEHIPAAETGPELEKPPWLPILGRTAAGMVHFWNQNESWLPDVTELTQLIRKHQQRQHRQLSSGEISTDSALPNIPSLDNSSVALVQLTEVGDDGISEFIECPEISSRFPDAFALRVDGDSMAPRIQDGDIVVLSPSVPSREGAAAVVKLHNQIGVTCKITRHCGAQVHLIAANEKFDPKVYSLDQVVWTLAVLWRIRLS